MESPPAPVPVITTSTPVTQSRKTSITTVTTTQTKLGSVLTLTNASDIEMKSECSTDSCREPPRKKVAIEQRKVASGSDNDSGLFSNPMTPSTGPESSQILPKNAGETSQKIKSKSNSETSSNSSNHGDGKEMMEIDAKNEKQKESSEEGYGYVSAQANLKPKASEQQESNSTSSNDDEIAGRKRNVTPHTNLQKPRPKKKVISAAEKRELRRKKLIERSKSKRLKVRALVHHVPTDEDIADLLKEFTVDFLLKGYSSLVRDLRLQLMSDENTDIDKSHFLWLITYFLKFASQLEVELDLIGSVLSVETVAYLTYEGVSFSF